MSRRAWVQRAELSSGGIRLSSRLMSVNNTFTDWLQLHRTLVHKEQRLARVVSAFAAGRATEAELTALNAEVMRIHAEAERMLAEALKNLQSAT